MEVAGITASVLELWRIFAGDAVAKTNRALNAIKALKVEILSYSRS